MLKFLSIRDFVIVSSLELEFLSGFTVLTGETGAGKSILIDALSLALGERGEAAVVRNGCERAEIAASFDVSGLPQMQNWLRDQELEGDEGMCLLRRVIDSGGRSRGYINGRSATLQQLRAAGDHLLDIHGQHAHQSLLRSDEQRNLLDGYAGMNLAAEKVATLYRDWRALHRHRVSLSENSAAVSAERDLLKFQRAELEGLNFNVMAWRALQEDFARLSHAANLLEVAAFGVETLSEADNACTVQLNALIGRLRDGLAHDARLGEILGMLENAQTELQEAAYALRHYQQRLDSDPQRLREMDQRIQSVMDAARKHRVQPEKLDDVRQHITARLAELGDPADLAVLEQQEKSAWQAYLAAAQQLSEARRRAAAELSHEITAAMQTLAMRGGRFAVALLPLVEGNANGLEAIEFQVAANPGTQLRSLARVASGGELSRISLAVQVVVSQIASVTTLIFDEVDSGIGGSVAEIVGRMLKRLGKDCQVLCVTHLPQVAAAADHQWQVSKVMENGETLSHVVVLDTGQRIEEIARMLGGVKITATTLEHAAEMLGMAA